MDSMDLEREKGITIKAKNAAFRWKDYHVNIVDTPGHADFGGEVERIMKMIDGVLLVVDAHDGPQAQTKFVLKRPGERREADRRHQQDRSRKRGAAQGARPGLRAFPRTPRERRAARFSHRVRERQAGFAKIDLKDESTTMDPLYQTVVDKIPPPKIGTEPFFQFCVANLDYSDYLGRLAYGRIVSGKVKVGGQTSSASTPTGSLPRRKLTALFGHEGLKKVEIPERKPATSLALPA